MVPFCSRSDNKRGVGKGGELASALEDHSNVVSDSEAAGASVATKKADNMANAELLRKASFGMHTEK